MSLFVRLQNAIPQHGLSRLAGRLSNSTWQPLPRWLIHIFMKRYGVDLADAERSSVDDYQSFNDFFTRALRPGTRPMPFDRTAVASPADGYLSQHGRLDGDALLQAKGQKYSVTALVHDSDVAARLRGGHYLTVYLSPRDYHRVHAPTAATLQKTIAIPGQLFSVNGATEGSIANLFCRNERLVCVFDRYVLVLVGALVVASIVPVWDQGPRSPFDVLTTTELVPRRFDQGEQIAHFAVGSTVIALFPPDAAALHDDLAAGQPVRLGESLGIMRDQPETA